MQEYGYEQTPKRMVDVLAIALKVGIYFLLGKVQGISPANMSAFQQCNLSILTIVFLFKGTITQA